MGEYRFKKKKLKYLKYLTLNRCSQYLDLCTTRRFQRFSDVPHTKELNGIFALSYINSNLIQGT